MEYDRELSFHLNKLLKCERMPRFSGPEQNGRPKMMQARSPGGEKRACYRLAADANWRSCQ